ncbi:MAG: SGNH/GDSL hydrolase family protein [Bacteroidales bacterium]|nr:SGNH/GDSL hydrolase family protein [Bacteroidales bacterium]
MLSCVSSVPGPLDTIKETPGLCGIFRHWGFIGDSLSSGEMEHIKADGNTGWKDLFEYSWPQYMMRAMGAEGTNWTKGGLRTDTWTFRFIDENQSGWTADGHSSVFMEDPKQAYVIALGVNDKYFNPIPHIPLGSPSEDICLEDLTHNGKTYAGYYGAIIQRIKLIEPRARIFVLTMPPFFENTYEDYSAVVREIASMFDHVYVVDLEKELPDYNQRMLKEHSMGGHLTAGGYQLTAYMVMTYIDWIIRQNPLEFSDVAFVGTKYHR